MHTFEPDKPRKCKNCGKEGFESREAIIKHHKAEHKDAKFCSNCRQHIDTITNMGKHFLKNADCKIKDGRREKKNKRKN